MSAISSCLGLRKTRDADTDPLLPVYEDDTSLQRRLRQRLHSYLMLRAIGQGYMPSTEQLIINLRTLLASEALNPHHPGISESGRLLIKHTKQLITDFIELLRHKNDRDQIQDFIWHLSKSRVSVDTEQLVEAAASSRAKADSVAAYESLKTVGSLLLTNSDFRLFLGDLNVIAREVFADTAFTLSDAARDAAKKIEPSQDDAERVKHPDADPGQAPSGEDLAGEAQEVTGVVVNGLARTGEQAGRSLREKVTGDEKDTLLHRLKQAISHLRGRRDYSDSVSTIAKLLQRYVKIYSRAVDSTINTVQESVGANEESDLAVRNFWSLVSSFGDREAWKELETRFNAVVKHSQSDPQFEKLVTDIGNFIQKLLTDPNVFDSANDRIEELRSKWNDAGGESSLRGDLRAFLEQLQTTLTSVANDKDVSKLLTTSRKIINIVSPPGAVSNGELLDDCLHVFVPLMIRLIQYIPIPRLEVSVPEIDLLLENLILEPGKTVNDSSFLPYKLRVETYNDLEVRKARFRVATRVTSLFSIKIKGLSVRADEVGYWFRAHSGILRLADEGIASFHLDEKGMDISIDVEVGKERLEKVLTLRDVRVKIHKLSYKLRKSKFSFFAWIFKPIMTPILRKVMERQVAKAIGDALHAANREILFARERLRATRITDPQDLRTFVRAIITRLTPEDDPDVQMKLAVSPPTRGVFAGVYAPGSVVKIWNEEAARAGEVVDDRAAEGWRNEVFEVQTQNLLQ